MPLASSIYPNKLAPKIPNKIPKIPPFYFFIFFSIVLVTLFNKISESSRVLTIFIMLFISSFEIISVVILERCIFFQFLHLFLPSFLMVIEYFFTSGTATFVNGLAFLNLVFCLVVSNIWLANLPPLNILLFIFSVTSVWFMIANFSFLIT